MIFKKDFYNFYRAKSFDHIDVLTWKSFVESSLWLNFETNHLILIKMRFNMTEQEAYEKLKGSNQVENYTSRGQNSNFMRICSCLKVLITFYVNFESCFHRKLIQNLWIHLKIVHSILTLSTSSQISILVKSGRKSMEQHPFRNVLETSNWQFFLPGKILP